MGASNNSSLASKILIAIAIIAAALAAWIWASRLWRDAQKLRIDPRAMNSTRHLTERTWMT